MAGQVVCCFHPFKNFPQFEVIYTVKGFSIVNKAKVDVFLQLSCLFNDPMDVGNLFSGSSAFSKSSLTIWKFMVHVLLQPDLENFENYFASMWDECNCVVVWTFVGIAFLWDPETPQRLKQNCVWVSPAEVWVRSGLPQEQGLWGQQTWVWHKPSWRRSPLTHHRAARTHTELGKQTLGRYKEKFGCTRNQGKRAVTPK